MYRKSKQYKKMSKSRKVISSAIILGLLGSGSYLGFGAYRYINDVSQGDNVTPAEIYKVTELKENDNNLIRSLKSAAFDAWLYNGNTKPFVALNSYEKLLTDITNGNIGTAEIDSKINELKKGLGDKVKDKDVDSLYQSYYLAKLPKINTEVNDEFNKASYNKLTPTINKASSLVELLNKVYKQKNMDKVVSSTSFDDAIATVNNVNLNVNEVNSISKNMEDYTTLTTQIGQGTSKLGQQMNPFVLKINSYISSKAAVDAFNKAYSELENTINANQKIIGNSINMPDFSNTTVAEAIAKSQSIGVNVRVKDARTADTYKDGSIVPYNETTENGKWDGNNQDTIRYSYQAGYAYVLRGSTIYLNVQNQPIEKPKPVEKPKPSISSSSSSISTSESKSSSSTSSTSSSSSSTTETKPSSSNENNTNSTTEQAK